MSKNFELLQEIGGDDELFRTLSFDESGSATDVAPGTPKPGPEVDKRERKAVWSNAALPCVLVPVEDAPPLSSPHTSEDLECGGQAIPHLHDTPTAEFLEACSPSPVPDAIQSRSTEDLKKLDESGNDQSDEWADRGPLGHHRSILSLFPPTSEPPPASTKGRAPRISKSSFGLTWLDVVKAGVKHWIRETTDQRKYRSCDLEGVTREEEIKLVQRVFPDTPESLRRMALFSGMENDLGCASICARAARVLASRCNGEVCLVDANFQSPSLHKYFGAENTQGLAEAALESSPFPTFLRAVSDPGLWLMPSGQAASKLRISAITDGLRRRMVELRDRFRYVVIHAGPVALESCAMQLSRWTDGVVIVLEANSTRRDSAKRIKETLLAANVNLLGVVLNNRTFPIPEVIYRKL
jgi:Mrp family chromosome partitioning ATPase